MIERAGRGEGSRAHCCTTTSEASEQDRKGKVPSRAHTRRYSVSYHPLQVCCLIGTVAGGGGEGRTAVRCIVSRISFFFVLCLFLFSFPLFVMPRRENLVTGAPLPWGIAESRGESRNRTVGNVIKLGALYATYLISFL